MCLIAIAIAPHPQLRWVVAANRDEFHERPSREAHWWDAPAGIFGGRDLRAGGGWMAVDRRGRFAAVTNVRRMQPTPPEAESRGALVRDYLAGDDSAAAFVEALSTRADRYSGFNLLLADARDVVWAGTAEGWQSRRLDGGVHALSNASLDTPWPKSRRLTTALRAWIARGRFDDAEALFTALADRRPAADDELPDTGVGLELERLLSAPFIVSPRYGTRASTVLVAWQDGRVDFEERRFDADGERRGRVVERIPAPG